MTAVALAGAAAAGLVAAATHAYMFVRESVLFQRPSTLSMLEVPPDQAAVVRLWAYHQGVYNLLLGAMAAIGAIEVLIGALDVGRTLLFASAAAMTVAATALLGVDRRRERVPGFVAQALPAFACLVALAG
jgi:putative membrane protein